MWVRRVQKVGRGTYTVSLPKDWVERLGLTRGSKLILLEGDSSLTVKPLEAQKASRRVVKLKPGKPGLAVREVLASYLLGYDTIRVVGAVRISPEERRMIKDSTRRLVGLEVVEEDSASITLQCILDSERLDVDKTFDRLRFLVYTFQEEVFQAILEDPRSAVLLAERDDEVDRLYFLLVRLLRSPESESKPSIPLQRKLDLRVAGLLLENIADRLVELTHLASELGELEEEFTYPLKPVFNSLSKLRDLSLKIFFEGNLRHTGEIERVFEENRSLTEAFKALILDRRLDAGKMDAYLRLTSILREIARSYMDIADLATPG